MNLAKAQKLFARISNLIAREGDDSAIGERIYVAAVLAVLLYGSELSIYFIPFHTVLVGGVACCCRGRNGVEYVW